MRALLLVHRIAQPSRAPADTPAQPQFETALNVRHHTVTECGSANFVEPSDLSYCIDRLDFRRKSRHVQSSNVNNNSAE